MKILWIDICAIQINKIIIITMSKTITLVRRPNMGDSPSFLDNLLLLLFRFGRVRRRTGSQRQRRTRTIIGTGLFRYYAEVGTWALASLGKQNGGTLTRVLLL